MLNLKTMLIPVQINGAVKHIKAFSDTHGRHRELRFDCTNVDILVCAGDICHIGNQSHITDFFAWFLAQPVKHKLFVSGNHDLPFELHPEYARRYVPKGITHLENGCAMLDGVQFYVPPVTMLNTLMVPLHVDVLVTHMPPLGILDDNGRFGSEYSLILAKELKPKVHIFGHVHQCGQQIINIGETTFYNVSAMMRHREKEILLKS
jgi:predicted phosphohydrolase